MRLPRVRFSVRLMMVAVGIVALLLCAERKRREWKYRDWCMAHAEHHHCEAETYRRVCDVLRGRPGGLISACLLLGEGISICGNNFHDQKDNTDVVIESESDAALLIEKYTRKALYHEELSRKFEQAACSPRIPISPDPPGAASNGVRITACGPNREAVLARIRPLIGLPPGEVRALADAGEPLLLASDLSRESALRMAEELGRLGASVEVFVIPPCP